MPVRPNLVERAAFFTLNAAPGPMLDLAGALAYQVLSTAVHLDIFTTLQEWPLTPLELAQTLGTHERGTRSLLEALAAIGYVERRNGRYHNTAMTTKWFLNGTMIDMEAAVTAWDAFLRELWPHAPEIVRRGERPFDFYAFTAAEPGLSRAHQRMMMGNANAAGAEILKHIRVPDTAVRLLDVGGGHGAFSILLCEAHPNLQATIVDSAIALETARENVDGAGLHGRITLCAADLWESDWGQDNDLILLFNLLHHYDLDTGRALLSKAHAALRPGGQVAILDQVEGNVFGAASAALVRLVSLMYFLFADGRTFSRDELTGLLSDSGFRGTRVHTLRQAPGSSLLVAAR